ncbi:hypothetical protein LOAG_13587 [Loa loa]|uniref:Uncharacterized protein n=1 Tax=Loa loa TaxID=7209 RepID=A0A1S0TJ63_LOALO|nr:hypothetical protein LOAG_13587 [Loa loa]EFO14928.1 hypothetical protein LOAG_13587 [Loa loa]
MFLGYDRIVSLLCFQLNSSHKRIFLSNQFVSITVITITISHATKNWNIVTAKRGGIDLKSGKGRNRTDYIDKSITYLVTIRFNQKRAINVNEPYFVGVNSPK